MRRMTKLRLRNKIIHHLNQWQQLGCLVRENATKPNRRDLKRMNRHSWRLVTGVARDGRSIMIWPIKDRYEPVPQVICNLMLEYEGRGAIVGCAVHIGDAWDIIYDDEKVHKRKAQTYSFRYWHEKRKSKGNSDE